MGRIGESRRAAATGREGNRGRADRVLLRPPGELQEPSLDRLRRGAAPRRSRQAPQAKHPRALLGSRRAPHLTDGRPYEMRGIRWSRERLTLPSGLSSVEGSLVSCRSVYQPRYFEARSVSTTRSTSALPSPSGLRSEER